ncbi:MULTISPECIES: hydroxymethylglutaryl-CoA reductase, degradative [Streptococcus]|uniref:3-hydroxy-3-methylglutaryl coenzyme A reductase n=1 Tax=Streptococcus parasanguinis TaxID=1318 RepID=A0A6L6LEF4_STRPA|nr:MULTISPECIES: hydroxymethylglutaryl-CoA reductase, degradative [Streptococcus]MBK5056930.1 hydroxymethylglutaryl-CoA reductase, degradative [Streptococcus parasanguinis]MDG3029461.1 hydroxymethylglutaryl-CoA reductase, degradative [Streptococcus sp. ST2]MTR62458.1 hydroxymethylglutaryl-CoA reductase, degradative [Streptococcus parasanguinis]MTR65168.1 hydroxymethylglutaryl-CoA reductase, degradative [Streptococcus parasanguinis]MTR67575.1 hydroxymethylglutaryl-CoA reductase, degradative [St
MARLPGFAKLSPTERIEALLKEGLLTWDEAQILKEQKGLPLSIADQLTENVLSTFDLPFSLAPYFLINGRDYVLPMVTEEPSVVAAASFAAKLIQRSGGFTTQVHQRQMIGEIALSDVKDVEMATKRILEDKETLLQLANEAYPSIVKRGGGARDLWVENKGDFLIVYLAVDPKEAMGANMLNTMLEALTDRIQELSGGQALMAILSNLATRSLVSARCAIDFKALSRNPEEAIEIAHRMELASQLAKVDPYRAATHNKGIFNGIDALVLATGNDWRAIEAGAHAYAAQSGSYKGLSHWTSHPEEKKLYGEITLPMPVATKGGSIGLNPTVQVSHRLLGEPSAIELAGIIASLGLAQNFAALKALVTTGIQAGHMKLQARSLALLAGAKEEEVPRLVSQLLENKPFNLEKAQTLLQELRK